jgi:hypothetical protein
VSPESSTGHWPFENSAHDKSGCNTQLRVTARLHLRGNALPRRRSLGPTPGTSSIPPTSTALSGLSRASSRRRCPSGAASDNARTIQGIIEAAEPSRSTCLPAVATSSPTTAPCCTRCCTNTCSNAARIPPTWATLAPRDHAPHQAHHGQDNLGGAVQDGAPERQGDPHQRALPRNQRTVAAAGGHRSLATHNELAASVSASLANPSNGN